MFTIFFLRIFSRRARGGRGEEPKVEQRIITKFCASHMVFLILMMSISRKEESAFVITYGSLRLCASAWKNFSKVLGVAGY